MLLKQNPPCHPARQPVAVHLPAQCFKGGVAATIAAVALLSPQAAVAGKVDHSWGPCAPGSPCVSSNSFMQPAQYLPPWLHQAGTQEAAFK